MWAAHIDKPDMYGFLICAGADPNAEDDFGLKPPHCLLVAYPIRNSERVFSRYGIDKESASDILEEPPLQLLYRTANNRQTLYSKLRVATKADIEEENVLGETILFKATMKDDESLVRLLLSYGANVHKRNRQGLTCLFVASIYSSLSVVQYLLEYGADPLTDFLLHHARFEWQYKATNTQGMNILHYIAAIADSRTMTILGAVTWITTDIDQLINGLDDEGWTPYQTINWRIYNNTSWALWAEKEPDDDPEETFQSFMELMQKIVDDHYGSDGQQQDRHIVLEPLPGVWSFDIVKESLLSAATGSNLHSSQVGEFQSDDEITEEEDRWDLQVEELEFDDENTEEEEQWEDAAEVL
ncbi:MAG: hypothetical protein Q9168_003476 [Polycauliona sp. 1 TL-2023]